MNKNRMQLLVIDDDELIIESLRLGLPEHWQVNAFKSLQEVEGDFFHAAFVDIHLTGNMEKTEGISAMSILSEKYPHLDIVAMSGDLNRNLMEKALKVGAGRFIAKPLALEEVNLVLDKIEALWQLRGVQAHSKSSVSWVGSSQSSENIKKFIASMAGEKAPILIEGESGVGKEVVAQLLHQNCEVRPFVVINVAAISENLFESEFFGHIKGAFTGAVQNKVGYVELAHGGDLFLDEIEALSLVHQAKLLRFLENGEYQKVGASETHQATVRVIAATNESLEDLVEKGKFREDLLYRLSGHKLVIPPLRERLEDVGELCQFFLRNSSGGLRKMLEEDALTVLKTYSWPGNIRQLKRICERLCLLAPLPVIRGEDVKKVLFGEAQKLVDVKFSLEKGLGGLLESYEKSVLSYALEQIDDVEELAKKLKISRSSLYKKIKDFELEIKK